MIVIWAINCQEVNTMGYSCSVKADETLDIIRNKCIEQTGKQDIFLKGDKKIWIEPSYREHDDGSITGSLHYIVNEKDDRIYTKKFRGFKIDGITGNVNPKWLVV